MYIIYVYIYIYVYIQMDMYVYVYIDICARDQIQVPTSFSYPDEVCGTIADQEYGTADNIVNN